MKVQNGQFLSIEQLQDQYLNRSKKAGENSNSGEISFKDILQQTAEIHQGKELRFSKHASGRLAEREITLTDTQLERLSEGAAKAEAKGIQESLVLVDELAFIVNVPNNTVITAMSRNDTEENIYTNIDGAVII